MGGFYTRKGCGCLTLLILILLIPVMILFAKAIKAF
jgi:hypothetical protein